MPKDDDTDEYYEQLKSDPRFGSVKRFLRDTLEEVIAERKTAKSVPKKKVSTKPHKDDDEDDEDENIFDSLFGPKK